MTDLAEFLVARIAEDEAVARAATPGPWIPGDQGWTDANGYGFIVAPYHDLDISDEDAEHVTRWQPARVLAECQAKRRIVAWESDPNIVTDPPEERQVLRLLALPYASHPDFQPEWSLEARV